MRLGAPAATRGRSRGLRASRWQWLGTSSRRIIAPAAAARSIIKHHAHNSATTALPSPWQLARAASSTTRSRAFIDHAAAESGDEMDAEQSDE